VGQSILVSKKVLHEPLKEINDSDKVSGKSSAITC
jgi:hypothetical protein